MVARLKVALFAARLGTDYVPATASKNFDVERIARSVARAAKIVPGATCLPQALAAAEMLRFHGHACELRIGLRQENERVSAHAWIEVNGRVVLGSESSKDEFTPLPALTVSILL
jgi:hypothetical protein